MHQEKNATVRTPEETAARSKELTRSTNASSKNGKTADAKSDDIKLLHDPVAFWTSWSEKKAACDQRNHEDKEPSCNCFEGMGSVM
jgi:hypothetical protein